jgi:hypothetical protein
MKPAIKAEPIAIGTQSETEGWSKDALRPALTPNADTFVIEKQFTNEQGQRQMVERTVEARKPVERIKKQDLPSLEAIRGELSVLVDDLKGAREDYVSVNLDDFYRPHKTLESEITRLKAELAEAEAKLAEAERDGQSQTRIH